MKLLKSIGLLITFFLMWFIGGMMSVHTVSSQTLNTEAIIAGVIFLIIFIASMVVVWGGCLGDKEIRMKTDKFKN